MSSRNKELFVSQENVQALVSDMVLKPKGEYGWKILRNADKPKPSFFEQLGCARDLAAHVRINDPENCEKHHLELSLTGDEFRYLQNTMDGDELRKMALINENTPEFVHRLPEDLRNLYRVYSVVLNVTQYDDWCRLSEEAPDEP